MTPGDLKAAQVRLQVLMGEAKEVNSLVDEASSRLADLHSRQREIAQAIARVKQSLVPPKEPVVSEHAMLRYLERAKGVDLTMVTNEILSASTRAAINFAPTGRIKKGDYTLVVKDRVVVSVL